MNRTTIFGVTLLSAFLSQAQNDSGKVSAAIKDTAFNTFQPPVFSSNGADAESELDQQDASSLLQSSPDVFMQFAGYQFGTGRYRLRGYAAENQQVLINGFNMCNPETGHSAWSTWGGLNDITRYPEIRFGNTASPYGFQGPGGYILIDTKASSFTKGTRMSYTAANRTFQSRAMLTYATGMMPNNQAFAFSVSSREGNQMNLPGTFFSSGSFFISADKRFRSTHLLSLSAFLTPVEQGRSSAVLLETAQLAETNYYNALWGYQDGKARNSVVSKSQQPVIMLSHACQANTRSNWNTSLVYNFGRSSITGLNWNNAANPRPDYYNHLPSYYFAKGDELQGDLVTQQWQTDVNTRQLNWDRMIAVNQANLYSLPSAGSINTTETRARYIVEERMEDKQQLGLNTTFTEQLGKLVVSSGLSVTLYKNRKYKQVNDLLGASYWLDYDQFADQLGVDNMTRQNNLEHPDEKITEGQKIGYDYAIQIRQAEAWMQAEYSSKRFDVYAALNCSGRGLWKESYVANGKFPGTSKGTSETLNFFNYGVKGGASCKLSGRQFFIINGLCMTRAPEVANVFVSQTTRNQVMKNITSESVFSGDANYVLKFPSLALRATCYLTQINNQVWLRRFWSDSYNTTVNYFMTGLNERHQGMELGIEKTLFMAHQVQGALGWGQHVYTSRPMAQAWQDNNSIELFNRRTVYLKNFRIGSSPQLVAGIGYKYNGRRKWFAGIWLNYFEGSYVEPNPDRRTAEAIEKYDDQTPGVNRIYEQQKLPGYYVINAAAGKSIRIHKRYQLKINLSVNNIANNKNMITGGYEQLRWDSDNVERFPSKYFFMTGATYLAIVSLNF